MNSLVREQQYDCTVQPGHLSVSCVFTKLKPAQRGSTMQEHKGAMYVPTVRCPCKHACNPPSSCKHCKDRGCTKDEEAGSQLRPVLGQQHKRVFAGCLALRSAAEVPGQEVCLLLLSCAPVQPLHTPGQGQRSAGAGDALAKLTLPMSTLMPVAL